MPVWQNLPSGGSPRGSGTGWAALCRLRRGPLPASPPHRFPASHGRAASAARTAHRSAPGRQPPRGERAVGRSGLKGPARSRGSGRMARKRRFEPVGVGPEKPLECPLDGRPHAGEAGAAVPSGARRSRAPAPGGGWAPKPGSGKSRRRGGCAQGHGSRGVGRRCVGRPVAGRCVGWKSWFGWSAGDAMWGVRCSRGPAGGPGEVVPSGPAVEAAPERHVCAVFRHPAYAAPQLPGSLTPPRRTRCPAPASSAPAGRASRSAGCAHGSDRAPCRPRSGCARGRPRCRTAS